MIWESEIVKTQTLAEWCFLHRQTIVLPPLTSLELSLCCHDSLPIVLRPKTSLDPFGKADRLVAVRRLMLEKKLRAFTINQTPFPYPKCFLKP